MSQTIIEFFSAFIDQEQVNTPSLPGNFLGGIYRKVEKGYVEVDIPVRRELCNPRGIIHGGMVALIADEYIGVAVLTLGFEHVYTSVNLNVDFLRPASKGSMLTAKIKVIKPGRKITNVEVLIEDKSTGKLVGKAMSNMLNTGVPMHELKPQ